MEIKDSVAIVTGGGNGIGEAIAKYFIRHGAKVAIVDSSQSNLDRVLEELKDLGGEAIGVQANVTSEAETAKFIKAAIDAFGKLNIVVASAGIIRDGTMLTLDKETGKVAKKMGLDKWQPVIDVNLTGTFLVCKHTLPQLLDGGGVIINTSSTAGVMGQPYSAAYCASKGGVSMMTRAIAIEYAAKGVRCNAVAPAGVDTPLVHEFGLPEGADFKQLDRIMTPLGYSTPSEVAGAIAYMASDEASYASGAILSIDGAISS